jgi:hypothetical protein
VAIIDTGVDIRHGGLRSIDTDRCWSWVDKSKNVNDLDGHGTYCAHFVHKIAPDAKLYVAQTFSGKTFDLGEAKHIAMVSKRTPIRAHINRLIHAGYSPRC